MTLRQRFGLVPDLLFAAAHTIAAILRVGITSPSVLLSPRKLQQAAMASIWASGMAEGINANTTAMKRALITPHARGIVLDIGAGHGHTLRFLQSADVSLYIAVEPNAHMHKFIRAEAAQNGFDHGDVLIVGGGIEALDGSDCVDTIVSVLTLCSVDDLRQCLDILYGMLRHGGKLLVYEHVKSKVPKAAWWQRFWTPLWSSLFDGCKLTVPALEVIKCAYIWQEAHVSMKEGDHPCDLFVHEVGVFVK
ncbi:hypothetical protein HDU82_003032 [Entophlyctis luteolus]|nr:hypothetical protein HDU82_003032 [Entophlyctis luteolus]